jgi:hypothetical protein
MFTHFLTSPALQGKRIHTIEGTNIQSSILTTSKSIPYNHIVMKSNNQYRETTMEGLVQIKQSIRTNKLRPSSMNLLVQEHKPDCPCESCQAHRPSFDLYGGFHRMTVVKEYVDMADMDVLAPLMNNDHQIMFQADVMVSIIQHYIIAPLTENRNGT